MLPLGAITAFLARQLGRILNTAFAWATTALFGRVPPDRSLYVSGMALAALLWPVAVAGVLVPSVATFLLAFVTLPEWAVPWVRPVMIVLAVALPLVAGVLATRLDHAPTTAGEVARAALRGYPTSLGLFLVLAWMLVLAPLTKAAAIVRRRSSAHVPIAVREGGYDAVVRDLGAALGRAGLPARARRAPWPYEVPGRILAALGGARVRRLVPRRLMRLDGAGYSVVVHPMDLALEGERGPLARARSAIARELMWTEADQTWTVEAQEVERALRDAAREGRGLAAAGRRIEGLEVEHDEWQVLYRLYLQARLRETPLGSDALDGRATGARSLGARLAALAVAAREVVAPSRNGHATDRNGPVTASAGSPVARPVRLDRPDGR